MSRLKKLLLIGGMVMALAVSGCSSADSSTAAQAEESSAAATSAPEESAPEETTTTTTGTTHHPEKEPEEYGKVIALTFDDGPNTDCTPYVLDVLEKYNVKASFFVIGDNINEESAAVMKRAYDMGCEINNHSRTHSYMNKMTAEEIAEEIKYTSDLVEQYTGEPTRFFRPPYIAVNATMFETIDMPFINGKGCNDWDDKVSVETRIQKTLDQAEDGGIILLHDASMNYGTVEALETIIPTLLDEGYELVTLSDLFYAKGIEPVKDDTQKIYSNAMQETNW